jgi:hypothetical protein
MLIAKKAVIWHHIFYNIVTLQYFYLNNNHMYHSKIGIRVLPSNVVTNDDLSKIIDTMTSGSKKEQGFKKEDT